MNERTALHSQLLLRWSAIALGASIPVSTALDNVLLVVTTAAFVFSGQLPATKRRLLENKSLLLPLLLFAALAMGTLYGDRKSTRLNSSHMSESRMPSSA